MEELRLPVLILHGEADVITCPEISRELYNRCSSTDKSLKIYPDCWHNMLAGEPPEMAEKIYADITSWFVARSDGDVRM
jgi:acylglycerol lipase